MRKEAVLAAIERHRPLLQGMLAQAGIPGYAAQVVFADGERKTICGGEKQRGSNQVPDENTIFMIGSCSKSFTALTAALLASGGRLDLNAPLGDLLPLSLERAGRPVRLMHLLGNSSGLPNLGLSEIVTGKFLYGKIPGEYRQAYPFDGQGSMCSFMAGAGAELVGAPGEQYIYSNEGFSLAAEALAAAGAKPFADLVRELVFAPLGMHASGYRPADFHPGCDFATGHLPNGEPAPRYFETAIAGAGGVLSSAADMGQYVLAMLAEGRFEGKQLFPLEVIRSLEQGRITHRTAASLVGAGFGPEEYGLGWMIYPDFLGTRVITHGGSTGNFSSSLFYHRELGFGITALTNGGGGEGILALFAFMVAAAALGKDPSAVFPFFAAEKEMRSLEGVYSSRGEVVVIKISYRQGRLWWETLDENGNSPLGTHPLNTLGDPAWRCFTFVNGPGAESQVRFFTGEDGLLRVQKDRNVLTRRKPEVRA